MIPKPVRLGTIAFIADDPLKPSAAHEIRDAGPASGDDESRWLYFEGRGPALNRDCFLTEREADARLEQLFESLSEKLEREIDERRAALKALVGEREARRYRMAGRAA